jgi:hypothetical protein
VRRGLRPPSLVFGAALLVGACGKKGPPLPPLRHNPQPVSSVRVGQEGDNLVVFYQVPVISVDNLKLDGTEVQLLVVEGMGKTAKKSPPLRVEAKPGERRMDKLPLPPPGRSVSVTARVKSHGAWSVPNRPVVFEVQPPPPPASAVVATNDPAGVLISWTTPPPTATPTATASPTPSPTVRATARPRATARATARPGLASRHDAAGGVEPTKPPKESGYFVRRHLGQTPAENLTLHPIAAPPYMDEKAQPGATYCYTVITVESADPLVASAETPDACLEVKDLRPPAAPTGAALLPQAGGLEISWSPSPEPDVLSYRVYRAGSKGPLEKLVERSASERTYVDKSVVRGATYRYVVTAVDRAGNESAQSAPVEGAIP